jgi:hypothetical protein
VSLLADIMSQPFRRGYSEVLRGIRPNFDLDKSRDDAVRYERGRQSAQALGDLLYSSQGRPTRLGLTLLNAAIHRRLVR